MFVGFSSEKLVCAKNLSKVVDKQLTMDRIIRHVLRRNKSATRDPITRREGGIARAGWSTIGD
jgi:hypothetical protein